MELLMKRLRPVGNKMTIFVFKIPLGNLSISSYITYGVFLRNDYIDPDDLLFAEG